MKKYSAGRLASLGLLLALSSIVFMVESLIPPLVPMAPYVKIGLANCIVLLVIVCYGAAEAFVFVLAKNLLTSLFVGWYAFPFNLAGSLAAYCVMAGLYMLLVPKVSLVAVSVAGAIVSNIARTGVAVLIMEAPSLYVQLPVVCAFGTAAGIIVGVLTILCVKLLPERLTNGK